MRNFLLLLLFSAALQTYAQNLQGVWEGKVTLEKSYLNLRLEMLKQEENYFGILYTRGSDKGLVYGCDYFVSGNLQGNRFFLTWINLQRAVGMEEKECSMVANFDLRINTKDSNTILLGKWVWNPEGESSMSLIKKDSIISEITSDEISDYIKKLYDSYEVSGLKLLPSRRLIKTVYSQTMAIAPFVVEISSTDSTKAGGVSVYANDSRLAYNHDIQKKTLRLRFDSMEAGDYDLIIVNESETQSKISVRVKILQNGEVKETIVTPTFTINPTILLTCK